MVSDLTDRACGALFGLAIGDALGGPSEGMTLEQIRSKWGRITDFLFDDQMGSDDTEYALFNAKLLMARGRDFSAADVAAEWKEKIVSVDNAYKGAGFSEILAIRNLEKGLEPPASGKHLHSWSDGLAMRVAPFGIIAPGNPKLAAQLAFKNGSVSNSGEGIFCGQATAAAIATAMTGASIEDIIQSSLAVIPKDSWTFSTIIRAIQIGSASNDIWSSLEPLYKSIVCEYYYWADIAPEAIGLTFGILAASRGNFTEALLGAINVGRDTDTIAAIAGAICGAKGGIQVIPEQWIERISESKGTCIRAVKGMNIKETAIALGRMVEG